jgi:hypothetical protein
MAAVNNIDDFVIRSIPLFASPNKSIRRLKVAELAEFTPTADNKCPGWTPSSLKRSTGWAPLRESSPAVRSDGLALFQTFASGRHNRALVDKRSASTTHKLRCSQGASEFCNARNYCPVVGFVGARGGLTCPPGIIQVHV